jgi:hypothetical protein
MKMKEIPFLSVGQPNSSTLIQLSIASIYYEFVFDSLRAFTESSFVINDIFAERVLIRRAPCMH